MSCKLLRIIAVSAAAAGTPLASALAANSKGAKGLPKGDLVVTFSGSGGGTYRFQQPRRFTMAGSGLYKGVALSGGCNSASCAVNTCANGAGGSGGPSACSFSENYVGTIEVRVVR